MRELARVTRPDGRILILAYRLSDRPGLRLWMRCLSPWLRWAFAGRYDTSTESHLSAAGLRVVERELLMSDGVVRLVLARGEGAGRSPALAAAA